MLFLPDLKNVFQAVPDTQENETQPEDPNEPDAALTPDNAVVVLSPYAASWEKTAAEALSAELGLGVVSDTEIPEGEAIELLSQSRYDEIVELIDKEEFIKDPMGAYRDKIYSKNAPMKTAVIWNEKYVNL